MNSSVAQGLSQAPATLAVTISRVCIEFTTSMNPATAPENAQGTAQREAGTEALPTLTSNSIIVLYTHVKTGRWSSVMPAKLADTLGLSDAVRAIPIVEPKVDYSIGLVVSPRDPLTPLLSALIQTAQDVAPTLGT